MCSLISTRMTISIIWMMMISTRRIMRIMRSRRISQRLRWRLRRMWRCRVMPLIRIPSWLIVRSMRRNPTKEVRSGTWTWMRTLILYDWLFRLAPYNKSIARNKPTMQRIHTTTHKQHTTLDPFSKTGNSALFQQANKSMLEMYRTKYSGETIDRPHTSFFLTHKFNQAKPKRIEFVD